VTAQPPTDDLAQLAAACGVATTYNDQLNRPVRVSPESVIAVLGALGVEATTPSAVRAALGDMRARSATPPVVVLQTSRSRDVAAVGAARLLLEDGSSRDLQSDGGSVTLPAGLPLGWHRLQAGQLDVPVVVAPDRLALPPGRYWGWMVQLYATPSARSWALGDLGDLRQLGEWSAHRGADLVLVNPLHAVATSPPMPPSPYYPASRRWTNPVYLRVEDIAAYAAAAPEVRSAVDALRPQGVGDRLDRDRTWAAKHEALQRLWRVAEHPDVDQLEPDLRDFATWCALGEVYGPDWRTWPEALRRPDAAAVAAARRDVAERVAFHAWTQMLVAEQLGEVHRALTAAGMSIGVVHDLAVGTDPAGADAWALQDALALGARIGVPPDTFNQQGQDWGMPPWHPQRLAELGYAPLRDMARSLLRHAGGIRIDHVLGLFRAWWVPGDGTARDGTFVRYDADALLGVVTLEAARAGAIVVGEDLGTVTPQVRQTLRDRGVLGTSVLWFERQEPQEGQPGPLVLPEEWRRDAVATVTTHDLPTALGWLRGEHVRLRAELGLLDDPAAETKAWERDRAELVALLRDRGLVGLDADDEELVRALHAVLAETPARVVLAALSDAVGDLRQPNLPGTTDEYPNWRLPVADSAGRVMLLDDLLADPRVVRLAAQLDESVR
jgi:4-alpha-glucanotransferase